MIRLIKNINYLHQTIEVCNEALKVMEENNLKDFVRRAKIFARLGKAYYLKKDYENSINFYDKSLLEDQNANVKDELKKVQKEKKDK